MGSPCSLGMCPGGEGAALKAVASRGVAGSNPVHSVPTFVSFRTLIDDMPNLRETFKRLEDQLADTEATLASAEQNLDAMQKIVTNVRLAIVEIKLEIKELNELNN